ncbi:hypothetical protein [Qipengyuania pacifica]|uniref:hypothetical protein n=1 Tax=Qipengyuania pacifica TaxID=2860199 RepID=UPI001C9DD784|nr:hypothetical protein [Qipengyuania pacifica]MBY8334977.1 hypothetical protein [Qipengyuania pacifica]
MRKLVLPVMLGALALPAPAVAQANVDDAVAALGDLSHQLRDPERQREMKLMMQAMTEVLLDMPIAPLAQAAADMAGEKAQDIDPDLTLRKMAPEAGRVGGDMMRSLLRAVDANAERREGGK